MTTPARCTRTWRTAGVCPDADAHYCSALESYHHVQHVCVCGNVEPPADVAATPCNALKAVPHPRHDNCPGVLSYGEKRAAEVQATPDPRLDVVTRIVCYHDCAGTDHPTSRHDDTARRILDALDAMRPDEMSIYDFVAGEGWTEEQRFTPAPAGLTPAQEIRDRALRNAVLATPDAPDLGEVATQEDVDRWDAQQKRMILDRFAWMAPLIEHGPDETPDPERRRQLVGALREANARAKIAEARADLAEARLGHIVNIINNYEDPLSDEPFVAAVRAAVTLPLSMVRVADFATEPDDTAPAGAATGDGS